MRPQDLADEQIAQMLAAMHVAREQQHAARRAEHEGDTDHRFLHLGPDALGPRKKQRACERRRECGDLHSGPLRLEPELVGQQHAAARDLRDGEIDEHDAAGEDLRASGTCVAVTSMPATNAGSRIESSVADEVHCAPFSNRAIVSS